MQVRFFAEGACLCPIVVCDNCGLDIQKEQGNVLLPDGYSKGNPIQLSELKVYHIRCDSQEHVFWCPLDELLADIIYNTDHKRLAAFAERIRE